MPFSVPKRLVLFGFLALGGILTTGCSTSSSTTPAQDSDNRLSAITVSAGAITPTFNIATDTYRLTVAESVTSTTVTATTHKPTSTLTINGTAVASGTASAAIPLNPGANTIPIVVTAQNGLTHTYTVVVTRALSTNNSLASLTFSKGILSPVFDANVHAYDMGIYSGLTSLTVTPTTVHPRATVKVNGTTVASGTASAPIALAVGTTAVTVEVTSESGLKATNTITIKELAPSTPVWVLDSNNGSPVTSAQITLVSEFGDTLETAIPVNAGGKAMLSLDPLGKYTIVAKGANSAQASYVNFDPSKETRADLYCHPLGMISFPAQAPIITEVSYSADLNTFTPINGNAFADNGANIKYLMVTAIGTSGISPTAWSGFGMGIQVDKMAWSYDYTSAAYEVENSTPVTVNGLPYYQSTYIFPVVLNNTTAGASHFIDVVVYDVANNRTEQKIYATVNNAVTNAADPDLSAVTPTMALVQYQTMGLTRDAFAVTPKDNPITYFAYVQFNVGSGATAPGIRGYELYRSADGVNFTKIQTQHYSSLNKGSSGLYQTMDMDPTLTEGVVYTYMVKVFSNNLTTNAGYSLPSATLGCQFLPPYTVGLANPAMDAVSMTRSPRFDFTISNPALFDPTVSDYFRFYLYIKDKVGNEVWKLGFRYNFILSRFEYYTGAAWAADPGLCSVSADHATISIQFPNSTTLMPGVTYEWTIFGTSTTTASSFFRNVPGTSGLGQTLSFGSTYEKSYGAINGYFTLTIDPNAQ